MSHQEEINSPGQTPESVNIIKREKANQAMLDAQLKEDTLEYGSEELELARECYLSEQEKEVPSAQVKYHYAYCLTRSTRRDDKFRGIGLLEDLIDESYNTASCLYNIALVYYSLGEYSSSRQYCERLIRKEPTHSKALALHDVLKEVVKRDGAIGFGIAAGSVLALGLAIRYLLSSRK